MSIIPFLSLFWGAPPWLRPVCGHHSVLFSGGAPPWLRPICGHHSVLFSGGPLPGCGLSVGIIPFCSPFWGAPPWLRPICGHHSVLFLSGGPLPGCGLPVGITPFCSGVGRGIFLGRPGRASCASVGPLGGGLVPGFGWWDESNGRVQPLDWHHEHRSGHH